VPEFTTIPAYTGVVCLFNQKEYPTMSLKQHQLVWRKNFRGPVPFKRGETCFSTVRSKVAQGVEFFILNIPKDHEEFETLNEEFKVIHNKDWDGDYLVPCQFVQFAEVAVASQGGETNE
jgi:hypothetical protein